MKHLLKQPLPHFLIIGFCLFILYEYVKKEPEITQNTKTIIVNKDNLLIFMQYRSKRFDKKLFTEKLAKLTPRQLKLLIDDYIREEVLHREALALNLMQDDYVIRRRLVQKLEFITKGFLKNSKLQEKEITDYFAKYKQDYYIKPSLTFTHVFFNHEKNGKETKTLAQKKLIELNKNKVPFNKSIEHGDRFFYHINYVERTTDFVASHFSVKMTKGILAQDPGENWQGPFKSPYGYHLVMLSKKTPGRHPQLKEIYNRVVEDAKVQILQDKTERAIAKIIESYNIQIDKDFKTGEKQ